MVKPNISEFTFAYAFLHEQTSLLHGRLKSVPILPSLRQEFFEGWDAGLKLTHGVAVFYQFKLSDILTRRNAKYIKDGTYSSRYYRVSIYKNNSNNQHKLLKDLANKSQNNVYYVAPELDDKIELNKAFLNSHILGKSRVIPLSQCKDIDINDSDQHYLTFQKGNKTVIQHSEPHYISNSYNGLDLIKILEDKHDLRKLDEEFAHNIFYHTLKILKDELIEEEIEEERYNYLYKDYDYEYYRERLYRKRLEYLRARTHEYLDSMGCRDFSMADLFTTAKFLSMSLGVTMTLVGEERK